VDLIAGSVSYQPDPLDPPGPQQSADLLLATSRSFGHRSVGAAHCRFLSQTISRNASVAPTDAKVSIDTIVQ
jgi:hypothetical protein